MSINIQDTFKVNISLPVDSRIVASNSNVRDTIQYKYDGLSVFQISDRKTYVWNATTATWSSGDITGGGDLNYVAKFSSSTGLTSSALYSKVGTSGKIGKIGINTNDPKDIFQVNKDTGTADPFLLSLSTNTILAFNWYNSGAADQSYTSANPSAAIKFQKSDGSIHILSRAASTAALNSSDTFNTNILARFSTTAVNFTKDLSMNNNNNSNSAAYLRAVNANSGATNPDYTWVGDTTTGLYHPSSSKIGISLGGTQKAILNTTGLLLSSNGSLTSPSSRLHLHAHTAVELYLQFSNSNTNNGSNNSFLVGIGDNGWPQFASRWDNKPILIRFADGSSSGGSNFYKIARNLFTIYSNDLGTGFSDQSNNIGPRTIIGTRGITFVNNAAGTYTIYSLQVPSNSFISVECTFNTTNIYGAANKNFRIHKKSASFRCSSSGSVSQVGTTDSWLVNSSPSTTTIGDATITVGATNYIDMKVQFSNTGGSFSGYSLVSFRATINNYQG